MFRERAVAGLEYLAWVTELLQAARQANPGGGDWEAADLQWWWRRDQHPDPARQTFWFDHDRPVAAVVVTDWGDRFGCEVLTAGHDVSTVGDLVWPRVNEHLDALAGTAVEICVRDDDEIAVEAVRSMGFEPTDEIAVATWMDAGRRAPVGALPDGFRLVARDEVPGRPHHMIRRNGEHVADRLLECPLYRPQLDLAVYDEVDDVAAYGLFWADRTTSVGLVEPMRTEDRYQRRGLARCVLTAGLERLARHGCSRLKVSYLVDNEASRRLYLSAGFTPTTVSRNYRHAP